MPRINFYHAAASTTLYANGKPWYITYGDMSQAQGNLGHDLARINNLEVQNRQLALVTNESRGLFQSKPRHILSHTTVTRPKYWQINVENVLANSKVVTKSIGGGNNVYK
ncbi:hypothetical protein BGZ81_001156 [Podila clonocystis]|nr:hypothetical protein BGZ81_001156 [Podila clonocystis]